MILRKNNFLKKQRPKLYTLTFINELSWETLNVELGENEDTLDTAINDQHKSKSQIGPHIRRLKI